MVFQLVHLAVVFVSLHMFFPFFFSFSTCVFWFLILLCIFNVLSFTFCLWFFLFISLCFRFKAASSSTKSIMSVASNTKVSKKRILGSEAVVDLTNVCFIKLCVTFVVVVYFVDILGLFW